MEGERERRGREHPSARLCFMSGGGGGISPPPPTPPPPIPGREAAIHAKYSQLPLVYGLIQALLQPVIQGKLLSLVVKHF